MAMVKNPFNGNLNTNSVYSALMNMIISTQTFSDNIKGTYSELVDEARVDGSMYGDTKLYISTQCLKTQPWLGDAEASNLLDVKRAPTPKVQAITIDNYRMIWISTDEFRSKNAFANEGTFSQFNSVVLGWIRETLRVADSTTYNVFIGTTQSAVQGTKSIDITTAVGVATGVEKARLTGLAYANGLANIIDDLKDLNTTNDYGFLRSYNEDDLVIVLRKDIANEITKFDLPTIYHKADVDITKMCRKLPARYFGTLLTSTNLKTYEAGAAYSAGDFIYDAVGVKVYKVTANITAQANTELADVTKAEQVVRAAIEKTYTITTDDDTHVFAGDKLPTGTTIGTTGDMGYGEVYVEDPDKIAVIMHKSSVPFMSAAEVSVSFYNPRALLTNNYLVYGRNTLDYLRNYPFLVIKKA